VHQVIYFEDIQFTLSSSQFWKTDCTVQRFWFREFLLAKRQIPVNLTELLYFALSLCSGTLIVLRPLQPPLPLHHHLVHPLVRLSIRSSIQNLYTRCRQKPKEIIREIIFSPSGVSESKSQENRHCFFNREIFIYFLITRAKFVNNVFV